MKYSHRIIIGDGGGSWAPFATSAIPTTIIVLPGEGTPTDLPAHVTATAPASLAACLHDLRTAYHTTQAIASLASCSIVSDHPLSKYFSDIRKTWDVTIRDRLASFFREMGNSTVDSWEGARNIIAHGEHFTSQPNISDLRGKLRGHAAICLGSGPSSAKYYDQVAYLSRSMYVFGCDSNVKAAHKAGIKVHFYTMIERPEDNARLLMEPDAWGSEPPRMICSPVIHPDCRKLAKNVLWWLNNEEFSEWLAPGIATEFAGKSSGTMSVAAALLAGCNPIYLVGHDLAYGSSGESHAAGLPELCTEAHQRMRANPLMWDSQPSEAPGWSGYPVKTTRLWDRFRMDLESIIAINPGTTFIRVGTEGAAIAGAHVAELPNHRIGELPHIEFSHSGIPDPGARIPSILDDLDRLEAACNALPDRIRSATTADLRARVMADYAIGSMVSKDNVWLFRGIFRSLVGTLAMRTNLRASEGVDLWENQRQALAIQAACVMAMVNLIWSEMKGTACSPN